MGRRQKHRRSTSKPWHYCPQLKHINNSEPPGKSIFLTDTRSPEESRNASGPVGCGYIIRKKRLLSDTVTQLGRDRTYKKSPGNPGGEGTRQGPLFKRKEKKKGDSQAIVYMGNGKKKGSPSPTKTFKSKNHNMKLEGLASDK